MAPTPTKYVDLGLNSVEEFWNEVLLPSAKDFAAATSPRTAFNAAQAAWHLHEWVWHERHPHARARGTAEFDAFKKKLIEDCPELAWLRDIAEAAKHRGLDRKDVNVDGAIRLAKGGYSGGWYNASNYEGGRYSGMGTVYSIELKDGKRYELEEVLRKAIEFWRAVELKAKNLPSPF